MEKLIQFRLQAEKLNQKEWKMFMHKLIQSFNKNDILSWIFSYFYQSHLNELNQQNDSSLASITNIVSNILQLRTKSNNLNNSKKSSSHELITINKLPSTMIQECASYLRFHDYIRFSNCSRIIYISCNSPSKLQKLTLSAIKLQKCNLNQFSSLKGIKLNPLSFITYIDLHPKQNNLNNLEELIIYNGCKCNYGDIQQFTNTKCIDFNNIKYLACENFGDNDEMFDFDEFCIFLTNFPNLIGLRLDEIFLTQYNDANENIYELFPKLQRLIVEFESANSDSVQRLRNKLINIYSHQMTHLDYDEEYITIDTKLITKLNQLKELIVCTPAMDTLNHIINVSTNLEALSMDIRERHIHVSIDNDYKIIDSIFTNLSKMRCLEFIIDFKQFDEIIKRTEIALNALLKINKNQKKELILYYKVDVDANDKFEKTEIQLLISRIVNSLNGSQINSYMFKCSFDFDNELNDSIYDYIMKQFEHKYLVFNDKINSYKQIIICNKDCKINGLRMDCFDSNF